MTHTAPIVDVIIPTLALARRAPLIRRAVDSALRQEDVRAVPLVVVNGPQADRALVAELEARPELRIVHLAEPSLPAALLAGRRAVHSACFAELDDDDILAPQALRVRLRALESDDALAAVVSNGALRDGAVEEPAFLETERLAADPLGALAAINWLNPGGALFRSSAVPPELFEGMPRYLEWTYLALRLAADRKLRFLQEPTFVRYLDSPLGTWTSEACALGLPSAFERLLELDLPPSLRAAFRKRLASAANRAAIIDLRAGRLGAAWRWHLRCLGGADGWRYLPFTRKLLLGSLRGRAVPA